MEEYCKWRPALDVLVLEIDAFHSWYVEPGDVKKVLDGGEIRLCVVLCPCWRCFRVSCCGVRGYSMAAKKNMPVDRTSGCRVLMFVGRPSGWACCLPAGW